MLFLYGFALPTQICVVCGIVTLIITIIGLFAKNKKWATVGILITVIWIEFPMLYSVYHSVILVYFVATHDSLTQIYNREYLMREIAKRMQEEALRVHSNISKKLEEFFQRENQISVTFSGGLEIYSVGKKIDDLIKSADHKLYESKQKGKNQITS